jgi:4-hydroxy-tetrahydrodipicolinate synthase
MEIQMQLLPLHKALFVESNPIPVKWAVARMGHCKDALRLPLTQLTPAGQDAVGRVLTSCGLV